MIRSIEYVFGERAGGTVHALFTDDGAMALLVEDEALLAAGSCGVFRSVFSPAAFAALYADLNALRADDPLPHNESPTEDINMLRLVEFGETLYSTDFRRAYKDPAWEAPHNQMLEFMRTTAAQGKYATLGMENVSCAVDAAGTGFTIALTARNTGPQPLTAHMTNEQTMFSGQIRHADELLASQLQLVSVQYPVPPKAGLCIIPPGEQLNAVFEYRTKDRTPGTYYGTTAVTIPVTIDLPFPNPFPKIPTLGCWLPFRVTIDDK